jgi:hypothetical protein
VNLAPTVARSTGTAVPRVVAFITAKRNIPLLGRSYGHWWIELDGIESYGWWPSAYPLTLRDVFGGTNGVLNGMDTTIDQIPIRDPNHGLPADYEFHPVLVVAKTDDELRNDIRRFAREFAGPWRWSTKPTMNCRLFQLAMFDTVGLVDGTGNYRSRGSGCPAVAPFRRIATRLTGRRYWPGNLPQPGERVASVLLDPQPTPSSIAIGVSESQS